MHTNPAEIILMISTGFVAFVLLPSRMERPEVFEATQSGLIHPFR